MAVYTEKKTYHTKAHMGMIDVTEDFQHAVEEACRQHGISAGTVTGFTTGGVAGVPTLEFEPASVPHDLKGAVDVFTPYLPEMGRVVPYWHHNTWHDDNGSSHIKAALLSPFITVPFVNGKITVGPYVAYGNSIAVDPWGTVLCRAGAEETALYADLDMDRLEAVRAQLPILSARRTDLYEVREK